MRRAIGLWRLVFWIGDKIWSDLAYVTGQTTCGSSSYVTSLALMGAASYLSVIPIKTASDQ